MLARTWAEPDYPAIAADSIFRLGSVSKLFAVSGLHQAAAEGLIALQGTIASQLSLKNPDGTPPTNQAYLKNTVEQLTERQLDPTRFHFTPHFSDQQTTLETIEAFKSKGATLPATPDQIARFMLTKPAFGGQPAWPPEPPALNGRLNDTGTSSRENWSGRSWKSGHASFGVGERLLKPLQITRLTSDRSLLAVQPAGQVRHHARGPMRLDLPQSVMTSDRPRVPVDYGDENLETLASAGGFACSAPDVARLLAALSLKPYTPVGRPAVDSLFAGCNAKIGGQGFDGIDTTSKPGVSGYFKGGLLQTAQAGVWFTADNLSHVILWNGRHTAPARSTRNALRTRVATSKMWTRRPCTRGRPMRTCFRHSRWRVFRRPIGLAALRHSARCSSTSLTAPARAPSGRGTPLHRRTSCAMRDRPPAPGVPAIASPCGEPDWRRCVKCLPAHCRDDGAMCRRRQPFERPEHYRLLRDSPFQGARSPLAPVRRCRALFSQVHAVDHCQVPGRHRGTDGHYHVAAQ